jgi:hypothetical protein
VSLVNARDVVIRIHTWIIVYAVKNSCVRLASNMLAKFCIFFSRLSEIDKKNKDTLQKLYTTIKMICPDVDYFIKRLIRRLR